LRAKEIIDILTTLEQGDPTKCIKLNPLKCLEDFKIAK
jgi:hypothetical protein